MTKTKATGLALGLILAGVIGLSGVGYVMPEETTLTVLYTNNTNGQMEACD